MKCVVLPSGDEIVRRCEAVIDQRYLKERFFPHLHKLGGRELVGPGVVMSLHLAIYDFMQDGPFPQAISVLMSKMVPRLVEAIVDDEEVRADALSFIADVDENIEAQQV